MDHYKHPRHFGELPDASVSRTEKNPSCGDEITIDLKVEGDTVTDVRFRGQGCAISIAAASMLAEEIVGRPVDDVLRMPRDEMLDLIGAPLSTMRVKCGLLGLHTAKKALAGHIGGTGGEW